MGTRRKVRPTQQAPSPSYTSIPMTSGAIVDDKKDMNHQLQNAVEKKNPKACRKLLDDGADANFVKDGSTLLHNLANVYTKEEKRANHIPHLLLNKGANINAQSLDQNTALHIAANRGLANLCTILVEYKKDDNVLVKINARNTKSMTPLHYAAKGGHTEVIKLLLQHGADPCCRDFKKYLPLHYAAESGHKESCKELVPHYPDTTGPGEAETITPIMLAASQGFHFCLTEMESIKNRMNLDYTDSGGNTALHVAAKHGFDFTLEVLLKMKLQIDKANKSGNTPLMVAVKKCKYNCMDMLIKEKANLVHNNNMNANVLNIAAFVNASDCLERLLQLDKLKEKIDELDKEKMTALSIAIKKKHTKCAELLIDKGALTNIKVGKIQQSLLHIVALSKQTDMMRTLINMGLSAKETNRHQRSPLHEAAESGCREACLLLLRQGADVNATEKDGKTALHISAHHGHLPVLQILVKHGANKRFELQDKVASTALHIAASKGHLECCKFLFTADKGLAKIQDGQEMYPINYALRNGHQDVVQYLLDNLPYKNIRAVPEGLQNEIHAVTHKALKDKSKEFLQTMTDSVWWEISFGPGKRHGFPTASAQCTNFRDLIKLYPALATRLLDKCRLKDEKQPTDAMYDFRMLEDNYYMKDDTSLFEEKKDYLLNCDASEYVSDTLEWKNEHPVNIMIQQENLSLLQHPVVEAWLSHKWNAYARWIYYALLVLQIVALVVLSCFMRFVKNWGQIQQAYNMTDEDFCKAQQTMIPLTETPGDEMASSELEWNSAPSHVCHGLVLISALMQLLVEFNNAYRLRRQYLDKTWAFVRLPCLLLMFLALIPTSSCGFTAGIKTSWIWQCGLLALVLAWFLFIHTINQHPSFTILAVITWEFVISFIKGFFILVILMYMFAFTFHMLIGSKSNFSTMWQSLMQMLVWIVGDYGYDDIFIDEIDYPIMSNFFFVLFVCTFGALFIQLIKSPSSDETKLMYYKKARRANLLLNIDICLPWSAVKRKHVVGKLPFDQKSSSKCTFDMKQFFTHYVHWRSDEKVENTNLQTFVEEDNIKVNEILTQCTQLMESFKKMNEQMFYTEQRLTERLSELEKKIETILVSKKT